MADRDLEERSHAYWRALAAQPAQRNAAESLSEDQARAMDQAPSMVTIQHSGRDWPRTADLQNGEPEATVGPSAEIEQLRRRRVLSP